MTEHATQIELARIARITDAPVLTTVDRNFGLPSALYVATVAAYCGFLLLMGGLFMTGETLLPFASFFIYIFMAFGLCRAWAKMKPANDSHPLDWGQFVKRGIMTQSGPLTATQATVQVLMLPVLILLWGVAVAVIYAFVG